MFDRVLEIQSHKGPYLARIREGLLAELSGQDLSGKHFIVDARVAELHASTLAPILEYPRCLRIVASEENKSLEALPGHISHLIHQGLRRGDRLIAIGGGIIQDITSFLAATLFRGLDWELFPTTLLAQADSGIGSKSSINVGDTKNLMGTFTPPQRVAIDPTVLDTLTVSELRSGVGEMLKVHQIAGPQAFERIARDYDRIFSDRSVMLEYIYASLSIKKRLIEVDEFDRGIRNILNYGHSFGHAIESATQFAVPHGIAVTLGMDLANFVAENQGLAPRGFFAECHSTLKKNYQGFETLEVPLERFFDGLSKDKKNTLTRLGLILPGGDRIPARHFQVMDEAFRGLCRTFLEIERAR